MRWRARIIAIVLGLLGSGPTFVSPPSNYPVTITPSAGCTITGVSLSPTSFTSGSSSAFGTLSATESGTCAADSFSVVSTGVDHSGTTCNTSSGSDFSNSGSSVTNIATASGTYTAICFADTIAGATGSPFVQAINITGSTLSIVSGTSGFSVVTGSSGATVAPNITITMSTGGFTGSLALATFSGCTSTNNGDFSLSGSTFTTTTGLTAGTYSICYSATQGGATSSCTITSGATCYVAATVTANPPAANVVTLGNDSGSTQAAGQATQTYGWAFAEGVVPIGNAPVFTDPSSNILHYSYGNLTYWPDGSLKFGAFMVLPAVNISGSGSQALAVSVSSGTSLCVAGGSTPGAGPWPCYGSGNAGEYRTTTDVYNQSLISPWPAAPLGTSIPHQGANLLGTWISSLQNDANNYNVVKWLDGDAGTGWRISTDMVIRFTGNTHGTTTLDNISFTDPWIGGSVTTSALTTGETINCSSDVSGLILANAQLTTTSVQLSSSAGGSHTGVSCTVQHGQLRYDHYVMALNDASHNLAGFRWTGAPRQPVYNSPTDIPAKDWRAFAIPDYVTPTNGPYWQASGVSATPLTWLGGDANPMKCQTFQAAAGNGFANSGPAASFTGTISGGTTLTVSGVTGTISLYQQLFGSGGSKTPIIVSGSGSTWQISPAVSNIGPVGMSTLGAVGWIVFTTPSPENLYTGSPPGNTIPGYFTSWSGSGGPNLNTTYWFNTFSDSVNAVELLGGGPPASPPNYGIIFGSAGSGTFCPAPIVEPFNKLFMAGPDAKDNYFKGTGNTTSETTLRVAVNQSYDTSTGVYPPYTTPISYVGACGVNWSGNTGSCAIPDILSLNPAFPTPAWNPWFLGNYFQQGQVGGDHPDLGPLPNDASVAFYNDTKADEWWIRGEGLSAGLMPSDFKDYQTDTIINIAAANGDTTTFPGMPASVSTSVNFAGMVGQGFTGPPSTDWSPQFTNLDASHKPRFATYAYLKTGDLKYLDLIVEQAVFGILNDGDIDNRNPPDPSSGGCPGAYAVGCGTRLYGVNSAHWSGSEPRTQAWDRMDLEWAADLVPFDPHGTKTCANGLFCWKGTLNTSGAQVGASIVSMANASDMWAAHALLTANDVYGQGTSCPGSWVTCQPLLWMEGPNLSTVTGESIGPGTGMPSNGGEEIAYSVFAFAKGASRGNTDAQSWITAWEASLAAMVNAVGGYHTYAFSNEQAFNIDKNYGGPALSDAAHYAITSEDNSSYGPNGAQFSWVVQPSPTLGSPSYTVTPYESSCGTAGPTSCGDPILSDGDIINFTWVRQEAQTLTNQARASAAVGVTGSPATIPVYGIGQGPLEAGMIIYDTTTGMLVGPVTNFSIAGPPLANTPVIQVGSVANAISKEDMLVWVAATLNGSCTVGSPCSSISLNAIVTTNCSSMTNFNGCPGADPHASVFDETTQQSLGTLNGFGSYPVPLTLPLASPATKGNNGDYISFTTNPPRGLKNETPYVVRDLTKTSLGGMLYTFTFNLAGCSAFDSHGNCPVGNIGSAIPTTNAATNSTGEPYAFRFQNPPGTTVPNSASGGDCDMSLFRAGLNWGAAALGTPAPSCPSATNLGIVLCDLNARLASSSWNPATGSVNCPSNNGNAGFLSRYTMQSCFAGGPC